MKGEDVRERGQSAAVVRRSMQSGLPFQDLYVRLPENFDNGAFRGRHATEADYDELVTGPARVFDEEDGSLLILHLPLEDQLDSRPVVDALETLHFPMQERGSGSMVSRALTVGFLPRIAIRRDYCTATGLAYEHAGKHAAICRYAKEATAYYQKWNPELYRRHAQDTDRVAEDWRIEDTPFTSGIVNKNSALPFHFDSGNFKDVWSLMLVFKRQLEGGYLCVPALRLAFECPHNSLFGFDGQGLLHGVTPIKLWNPDGVRYSIVFYSLAHMWDCLPPDAERERISQRKNDREQMRLRRELAIRAVADLQYQPHWPVYVLLPTGLDVVRAGAALVLMRSGVQVTLVGCEEDCKALIKRIGGKYRNEARYLVASGGASMDSIARTTARDVALADALEQGYAMAWLVDAHTKRWELEVPELGYTMVTPNALFQRGEQANAPVYVPRRKGEARVELAHTSLEIERDGTVKLEGCYAA